MDTYTARTPVDLLALAPIVIGFHPEDSVVLLTFGSAPSRPSGSRRVAESGPGSFQARVDLPVAHEDHEPVARMLVDVVARHQIRVVALVFYSADEAACASFADQVLPGLADHDVELIDVLRTDGDQYFRVLEPGDPGTPYDLAASPLTATGVLHGRVVHPSRTALQDTLIGTDDEDAGEVEKAASVYLDTLFAAGMKADSVTARMADEARWLQRFLPKRLTAPRRISAPEAARVLVLLSFDSIREVAWTDLHRGNAAAYVDLLRLLVRRAPADLRYGVAGLLALASWLAGDGALAWCAVDRSLESKPDDSLARHVAALLESATPPAVWAPLPASALPLLAVRSA